MSEEAKVIRVGSRKSQLALIQTKHVISELQKLNPEKKFEIHTMTTMGDRVLNVSLPKIGEKSLFTRDLEDALRQGGVDFVVHSLKDLPTVLPDGMTIGAILEREDARDALVLNEKHKGKTISTIPAGSVIGTSSLRRAAQIRRFHPNLEICDIRGNLNTRLAKLDAENSRFAGIILAQAGLLRMGWVNRISQILEPSDLLYAVGQGALAVECRSTDTEILKMLQKLMCLQTTCRILTERSFLKTLGGGCSAPVAVATYFDENLCHDETDKANTEKEDDDDSVKLTITGAVWSLDGKTEIRDNISCRLLLKRKSSDNENEKESEDVSPEKRSRLNSDDTDENNEKESKQGSPKVISDDKFPTADLMGAAGDPGAITSLQHLINVHGELFKKCPYYAIHQKERENGSCSEKKDECPLKIPVGQDFMGKCPYVDTDQQVKLEQMLEKEKSPIPVGDTKGNVDSKLTKCPFSGKVMSSKEKTAKKVEQEKRRLSHESCPFLQQNIKTIDYDESKTNKNGNENLISEKREEQQLSEQLFCGLYRHKCYDLQLFEQCESLGKTLAENLIAKGALEVMKCSQDEIRGKN